MFLSLLHVNTESRPGRQWLGDVYRVHQRLWMAFPNAGDRMEDPFFLGAWSGPALPEPKPTRAKAGFLFRVERDGQPRILVQSVHQPDWGYAFQNAPYLLASAPKLRQFDPAPCRDQAYRFRLLAHVVDSRSIARDDRPLRTTQSGQQVARRKRTEVVVHPQPVAEPLPVDLAERRELLNLRWEPWRRWLEKAGTDRGFRIDESKRCPLVMQTIHAVVRNPRWQKPKRYNAGLFEGVLCCSDPDRLRGAIIHGVGHGKAFGFGLLSLAPV